MTTHSSIAVVIPAYNEELTISAVMMDFHHVVPEALIVVVDNGSTDSTCQKAKETAALMRQGACTILCESRRGKAAAVKRAFHDIDADVYVMVDADSTYPARDLPSLLQPVMDKTADIVIGNRHADGAYGKENKRRFHNWGNHLVRDFINILFHGKLIDILSGYRVMNRDFVKNFPILSSGFAIETEMSIHILDKGYKVIEMPTHYVDRPAGSVSKLDTVGDGIRIMLLIFNIFINFRPMLFFSAASSLLIACGLVAGAVPVLEFVRTSLVSHFPLAVLAVGLVLSGCLSFFVGVILSNSYRNHRFLYEHLRLTSNN